MQRPRVLIFTAISKEYKAVRAHLTELKEAEHEQTGTLYETGRFEGKNTGWEVVILEAGMGNVGAAAEAERAIRYFAPDVVVVVGIAGATKDAELGDVVVASKVYGYEPGKAAEGFLHRPEASKVSYRWLERAKKEAREDTWAARIKPAAPTVIPRVHIGPIASGEKVVTSTTSETYHIIKAVFNDTQAVEMESIGVMLAVHHNETPVLVVRGISDKIEDKAEADKAGSQEVASGHAAAFAFEVLHHMTGGRAPGGSTPAKPAALVQAIEDGIRLLDFTGVDKEDRPAFQDAFGKAFVLLLHLREKILTNQVVFQQERTMAADELEKAAKKSAFPQARGENQAMLRALAKRLRDGH